MTHLSNQIFQPNLAVLRSTAYTNTMVTLSREYFTKSVEEALKRFHMQEVSLQRAQESKADEDEIEMKEMALNTAWSRYRLAMVTLERFDLGKMVRVEGRGYYSSYKKAQTMKLLIAFFFALAIYMVASAFVQIIHILF